MTSRVRCWHGGRFIGALVCLSILAFCPTVRAASDASGAARNVRPAGSAPDSLVVPAEGAMAEGRIEEAIAAFTRLAGAYPDDAVLRVRLGTACLKKGDFKAATRAFEAAKRLDPNLASAHVGMGLVFAEMPAKGIAAYYNFRRAVGEAKRATKLDSTCAAAYRLLGEVHEHFEDDHEKAIQYFQKYVELEPDNADGLYYFGLACVQGRKYRYIDRYIAPYLRAHPGETRLIPLVAQSHFFQERYGKALEFFERYIQALDPQERALYTDISLVASSQELQEYSSLTDKAQRQAFLNQFWLRRDPDILTRINERIIEHYRRVWYARTFFADEVTPWDRRGEVYIRYGEPDYRSRSTHRTFTQNRDVDAVRTRMALNLYGPDAASLTFIGPVFPIRSFRHPGVQTKLDELTNVSMSSPGSSTDPTTVAAGEDVQGRESDAAVVSPQDRSTFDEKDGARFDEQEDLNIRLKYGDYIPVTLQTDVSTVPWETWTYTEIQGGIEFVFTDERSNGRYDFAPIPPVTSTRNQMRSASRLMQYAPSMVYQRAVGETPDYYRPNFLEPPLNFYYDTASFQGAGGKSKLEVYYGIPPNQVRVSEHADSAWIHVQCAIALANKSHTTVYRSTKEFVYRGARSEGSTRGSFLPEELQMQVPPGKYEFQVQLRDLASGHTGRYRQKLEVPAYGTRSLEISDVQLASSIENSGSMNQFRKGEIWVIPMPTRDYGAAQKVYAYYEVYNLTKDSFGRTRYRVQYRVRSSSGPSVGLLHTVSSGFGSLFRGKKPQVSVGYEHSGSESDEPEYFELDLAKARPGVQAMEVIVEDLVSGKSASREVRFRYGK